MLAALASKLGPGEHAHRVVARARLVPVGDLQVPQEHPVTVDLDRGRTDIVPVDLEITERDIVRGVLDPDITEQPRPLTRHARQRHPAPTQTQIAEIGTPKQTTRLTRPKPIQQHLHRRQRRHRTPHRTITPQRRRKQRTRRGGGCRARVRHRYRKGRARRPSSGKVRCHDRDAQPRTNVCCRLQIARRTRTRDRGAASADAVATTPLIGVRHRQRARPHAGAGSERRTHDGLAGEARNCGVDGIGRRRR